MEEALTRKRDHLGHSTKSACFILVVLVLVSCAHMDPGKVDVEIDKTRPVPKITTYTEALTGLGLMSEIYETEILRIQSIPIYDNTGAAIPTGGEIPRDISEMVKSVLNSVGGNLIYVPYDPSYIQNQMVTGYSNFQNKLIPDVVVSGGITEFDRGLEAREMNTDVSSRLTYEGLNDYLPGLEGEVPYPSKDTHLRYSRAGKAGLARITLDFNLLNFHTMSGIPKMNTVNTIEVQKAMDGKEMGISIFGQAFGRKGKIKKVQGRHAAIRLLVELSMIQIIGRQLILPYWNLLGDDALPDRVVIDSAKKFYESLTQDQKLTFTQQQLFLYGYDVPIDGTLEENTIMALQDFYKQDVINKAPDTERFLLLWSSIPINQETVKRRYMLNATLQRLQDLQNIQEQQEQIERQKQIELQKQMEKEQKQKRKQKAEKISKQDRVKPEPTAQESGKIPMETVDGLLRMLENKKRKAQGLSTIPDKTVDQFLKRLEGRD